MSDVITQFNVSGGLGGQAPVEEPARVAGHSATRQPWYSRPAQLIVNCGILLAVAIAVGTAMMLWHLHSRALAEKEQDLQNTSLILAKQIQRDFRSIESVQINLIERLKAFEVTSSEDFERKMSGYDTHALLEDRAVGLPYLGSITLVNSQGKVFNFSRSWPVPDINVSDRDFFTALQSDERLNSVISKPIRNRATGTWVVQIARKVPGPNGEFLGLVLGAIELQSIEQFLARVALGPNSAISLIHHDGELMARYPHAESLIGRPILGGVAAKLVSNSDQGVGRRIGTIGNPEDRLVAAHRVDHYPFLIAATTSVAAVLADWWRTAIYLIGIAALSILVVAAGIFLLVRQFKNDATVEQARAEKIEAEILREQTIRMDAALNNMTHGLVMYDAAFRIVVCNRQYIEMYGLSPEVVKPGCEFRELIGHRKEKGSFTGDVDEYCSRVLAGVANGNTLEHFTEIPDGRIIQIINSPMENGGRVSMHLDITERRRVEKNLQQREQELQTQNMRFETALDNMAQGLIMFDSDARLVVCNDRYRQICKLPPDLVKPGCTFIDILKYRVANGTFTENPEEYAGGLLAAIAKGEAESREIETADGRIILVVNQPMAGGGWVATHEDITEKKRQEASFRLLFKNNPVPMWVYDLDSLRFLAVNDAVIAHYGYSRDQFLAMTVMDIRPSEERERFAKFVQLAGGVHNGEQIGRHQKSDNTKIDVAIYSCALSYAEHNAALVAVIDVTERKQAAASIEESHKNLERAETMALLGHYRFEQGATTVTWSDGLYRIVGKSRETFTPTLSSALELVHPDDRQALEQYRRDGMAGLDLQPVTLRLVKDDGQIVYVENWARPLHASDGSVIGMFGTFQDITKYRRAEEMLAQANQDLIEKQYTIDQAVIVAITDVKGNITHVNDKLCQISGYTREELVGNNHRILNSETHSEAFFRDMYRQIASGDTWRGELCNKAKDGSLYWVDTTIVPQLGRDGKPKAYQAIRIDITARKLAETKISYVARHDALTGIANRAVLQEKMEEALARLRRRQEAFSVFLLDLDGFKHINDSLGHAAGDVLLKELAQRLTYALRETDILARLGGDEFAIIQSAEENQREEAIALAGRVLEIVAQPFNLDGHKVTIGTSIGIAFAPEDGADAGELLKKADLALYRVKSDGRNNFCFFDAKMSKDASERMHLLSDMRAALTRNEFELYYQPIFDAKTSRPCGAEALVRWRHPIHGMMPPDRFIPLAEESGLMEPLGEWILEQACSAAAAWPDHTKVAVNLSAVQFRSGRLLDVILCALVESGLPPERLELEITESVLMQNAEGHRAVIQQLKNIGVSIALDDFGTGYSSLSYLTTFPFDKIKIDKSFTQGLTNRAECATIVASVLTLARGLDMRVTAEGVETKQQFELLRAAGVHQIQGYLFARPTPLAELNFAALNQKGHAVEAA